MQGVPLWQNIFLRNCAKFTLAGLCSGPSGLRIIETYHRRFRSRHEVSGGHGPTRGVAGFKRKTDLGCTAYSLKTTN